jgi:HEAT repeat protein
VFKFAIATCVLFIASIFPCPPLGLARIGWPESWPKELEQIAEPVAFASAEYMVPIPSDAPADVRQQIERLHSPDPEERAEAIRGLARMKERASPAIPFLVAMLGDDAVFPLRLPPSSRISWFPSTPQTIGESAAIAFRSIGEPSVEPLMAALGHRDWRVRANAIWALGNRWGPGDELPGNTRQRLEQHLFAALKDEHPRVRKYAVKLLGIMAGRRKLDNPRAAEILIAALSDKHLGVRAEAAAALGAMRDPRAVEPLIAALKAQSADELAAAPGINGEYSMLYSLFEKVKLANATIGEALDAFARKIKCRWVSFRDRDTNEYSAVRVEAARALGQIGDLRAIEPLIAAIEDRDPEVRVQAVAAVRNLQDPRVPEVLIAALDDDHWSVRAMAITHLGSFKNPDFFGTLVTALTTDESPGVRARAAEALAGFNDLRATEPLIATLRDENSYVRWHTAEALKDLKDPRAVEPLIAALSDEDHITRRRVIAALGELKDTRAVEPLIALLEDQNDVIRMDAREALQDITGLKLGEDPEKWREWWEENSGSE